MGLPYSLFFTFLLRFLYSHVTFPRLLQALWVKWGKRICNLMVRYVIVYYDQPYSRNTKKKDKKKCIYYLGLSFSEHGPHRRICQVFHFDDGSTSSLQLLHILLTWFHTVKQNSFLTTLVFQYFKQMSVVLQQGFHRYNMLNNLLKEIFHPRMKMSGI